MDNLAHWCQTELRERYPLAPSSATQRYDVAGAAIANAHILERMVFLLATVVLALAHLVFRSLDRALGSITNELTTVARICAPSSHTRVISDQVY